jgi:hypothetical protein
LQDCTGVPTGGGAGGGSGGGAGGGTGGGTGGGGTGGGSTGQRCRTYATQFTTDTTGGEHQVSTDTASFDVSTLTYTHSWTTTTANTTSMATETSVFASVAAFVDVGSTVIEGRGGPQQTTIATNGATTVTTMTYDSQGRALGYTVTTNVQSGSFTVGTGRYTQWDALGRPTNGTLDMASPIPGETCTGIVLTMTRDDSARTGRLAMSGGTSTSQLGIDNCRLSSADNSYDANFILVRSVHTNIAPAPPVVTDVTTVQATATVCY